MSSGEYISEHMWGKIALTLEVLLLFLISGITPQADTIPQHPSTQSTATATRAELTEAYGKLPLTFIANNGQTDPSVLYYAHVSGGKVYLTQDSIVLDLARREKDTLENMVSAGYSDIQEATFQRLVLRLNLEGASSTPLVTCQDMAEGKVNYLIGNDPSKWVTDIPTYREIIYHDIYPSIDLRFYGNEGALTYDFIVHPGGNVDDIRLAVEGIDGLDVSGRELVLNTAFGPLKQNRLSIYQHEGIFRNDIDGSFRLLNDTDYGFIVATYDRTADLVIDPALIYSTYLGGSGMDYGVDIAVDAMGCAYVTGYTHSLDFPLDGPFQGTCVNCNAVFADAFVAKFNTQGNSLVYCTYFGGSADDRGYSVAVDSSGSAYITGYSASSNTTFPLRNPFQGQCGGNGDAFVAKLNARGNDLIYSTFFGGSNHEGGRSIAVDSSGCAYITGETISDNTTFPLKNAFQGIYGGGGDAFMAKLNAGGNDIIYSTYIGGSAYDVGNGIAIDSTGCAYITGDTMSNTDFPLRTAFQAAYGGGIWDSFITKLNAQGDDLVYSTYLGGSDIDRGFGIAVDMAGCAYITGVSFSDHTTFPLENPFQGTIGGSGDVYVTKLNTLGNELVYSTYYGGEFEENGLSIAIDTEGCAYITGITISNQATFPLRNPFQPIFGGGLEDAFVAMFSAQGNELVYSTYLGGNCEEQGLGITVDTSGNAYVIGYTNSGDFPIIEPLQATYGGGSWDAFVTKIENITDATVATATGTGIATFNTSLGSISELAATPVKDCSCQGAPIAFPHGLFSFTVNGLTPGSTVIITITLPSQLPAGSQYWKCINSNWVNCTSLLGSNDGDNIITLTITDGGLGDADGQDNGTIVDPGGPGIAGGGDRSAEGASTGESTPTTIRTANLRVAMLNVPGQTHVNQPITISANVVNDGSEAGSTRVALKINGQVEQTKMVTVGGGSSRPVKFTVTKAEPGTYTVTMGSQRASFVVTGDRSRSTSVTAGAIAMILLGFLVLAVIIVVAFSFRRRPSY